MNYSIVLASSSPRRLELIRTLGIEPLIIPSDVDESVDPMLTPSQVVEELASRKACSVASALPSNGGKMIVIGSDTIVVQDGEILGKPQDEEDARRMLRRLAGRSHHVYSGIACIDAAAGRELRGHRRTVVHMKALNDRQIERYIATGEPMDKAGGYDTTMQLGDIGQYRIISESPDGRPEIIVGHTVSKVTFRPMSDEEIWAYVKTGDPLDKAGAYGVQGIGSVFIEKIEGDFYSIMGLPLNLLYQMLLMFGISLFNQS
jgi:septum formation protein